MRHRDHQQIDKVSTEERARRRHDEARDGAVDEADAATLVLYGRRDRRRTIRVAGRCQRIARQYRYEINNSGDAGLTPIREQYGPDSLAVYLGNPNAHNLAGLIYGRVLLQAARTKNVYSASTVDQMPKQVSAGLMFGGALTIPIPDVDRTDYLLMLGANPYASNGSLLTAPAQP